MPQVKRLIDLVLASRGCAELYNERLQSYPEITQGLPREFNFISNDKPPWHCNGLAFRMATYPRSSEKIFIRLNDLFALPKQSDGWHRELTNWQHNHDHWTEGWGRFFQFLWMLQCFEYFSETGYKITFPYKNNDAAPDLKIERKDGICFFAECFVYSKWWFGEIFLDNILEALDPNLSIRRIENVLYRDPENPFSKTELTDALNFFAEHLTLESLEMARNGATKRSPHVLCERAGIEIVLDGEGDYQPDLNNAQGDPRLSREVFIREIIKAKDGKNQLEDHRPNVLMVNGLGRDFQNIFRYGNPGIETIEAENIDGLLIAACGIGEHLNQCSRVLKF